jgi:hypothetical protein
VAPQGGNVPDVVLAAGCVVVVVDPLPLLGTAAGGLAPDPQAAASTPTSTTPARRAMSLASRGGRSVIV